MLNSFRRWWQYMDGELRQDPTKNMMWFLMGHVIMTSMIGIVACGVMVLIFNDDQYGKVFIAVSFCSVMAFFIMVKAYSWFYPQDGTDPNGRRVVPFTRSKRDT